MNNFSDFVGEGKGKKQRQTRVYSSHPDMLLGIDPVSGPNIAAPRPDPPARQD